MSGRRREGEGKGKGGRSREGEGKGKGGRSREGEGKGKGGRSRRVWVSESDAGRVDKPDRATEIERESKDGTREGLGE